MTGRTLLVFFCLLGLAAPVRAADAPASPPSPSAPQVAPQADAGLEAGREQLHLGVLLRRPRDLPEEVEGRVSDTDDSLGHDGHESNVASARAAIEDRSLVILSVLPECRRSSIARFPIWPPGQHQ